MSETKQLDPAVAAYWLLLNEAGGCDDTIGCGMTLYPLRGAQTVEAATAMARRLLVGSDAGGDPYWGSDHDWRDLVIIPAASAARIPIGEWEAEAVRARTQREHEAVEAREREDLARLRKKYEGR